MHYELYIDVFFMVNFMMDAIILLITRKVTGSDSSYKRLYLGAMAGAVLTCLILVLPIPVSWMKLLLFHIPVSFTMIQIGLGTGVGRELIKTWICLYFSSFLVGGVFAFLEQYIRIGSLFFMIAIISYYVVSGIVSFLECLFRQKESRCQVVLSKDGHMEKVQALIDTGNCLRDSVTKKPVHIIDAEIAGKLFSSDFLRKVRYIPYHSIGKNEGLMPLVSLDGMWILKKKKVWIERPMVAISEEPISEEEYRIILNPEDLR